MTESIVNEAPATIPSRNENPMIGSTPRETIERVVGALQWLNALDNHVGDAFGGEPIDSIAFGRHLLGKCCINALKATGHDLNKRVVIPAPAEAGGKSA